MQLRPASILSRAEFEFGIQMATTTLATSERTRRLNELDEIFEWLALDMATTRSYGIVAASARASQGSAGRTP